MRHQNIQNARFLRRALLSIAAFGIMMAFHSGASAQSAQARCDSREAANFVYGPWSTYANFINEWPAPEGLVAGDVLTITATGHSRIDWWGTSKPVQGEGVAPDGWPLSGAPRYALLARVTSGSVMVPTSSGRERRVLANRWFLVGSGVNCIRYEGGGGTLEFMINDPQLNDNGGGPRVTIRQYW